MLSADMTYLDSHYRDYRGASAGTLQNFCSQRNVAGTISECNAQYPNPVSATQDLSGRPTDYSPKWSGSLDARYTLGLPRGYLLVTQLSRTSLRCSFWGEDRTTRWSTTAAISDWMHGSVWRSGGSLERGLDRQESDR